MAQRFGLGYWIRPDYGFRVRSTQFQAMGRPTFAKENTRIVVRITIKL